MIGHSLGGLIAMRLGLAHPGDAGRIMIVDSLPFITVSYAPGATVAQAEPIARAIRDKMIAGTQEAYAAAEPRAMARLIESHGAEAAGPGGTTRRSRPTRPPPRPTARRPPVARGGGARAVSTTT